MSEIAIRVKNVSKKYTIYDHTMDRLKEAFSIRRKKFGKDFLALQDISFEIKKGEFFGIVGRNGAGKSTLLKLLSNELFPTSGEIEINGKIALLQIGVGFDKELSGIDNASFAAKVMGFSEKQIAEVVKNVEEFAELGEFYHHPVKTYSTGMYSRLSFSIAINVDPEILIVDEVLAVGDMRFSQKCLRKMHEFKERGKTVVLVAHDTGSIGVFCDRAMWIKDGTIYEIGPAKSVAEDYRNFMLLNRLPEHIENKKRTKEEVAIALEKENSEWDDLSNFPQVGDGVCRITHVMICQKNPFVKKTVFAGNEEIVVSIKAEVYKPMKDVHFGVVLRDRNALMALHLNSQGCGTTIESVDANQRIQVKFNIKLPNLNIGDFIFSLSMGQGLETHSRIHDIFPIKVHYEVSDRERQYGYVRVTDRGFFIDEINPL